MSTNFCDFFSSVFGNPFVPSNPWLIMDGITTVSYTHLDVYKRQLRDWATISASWKFSPKSPEKSP